MLKLRKKNQPGPSNSSVKVSNETELTSQDNYGRKKLNLKKRAPLVGASLAVLGFVFIATLVVINQRAERSLNSGDIKIGDTTISQNDVSSYVASIEKVKKDTPAAIIEGDNRQTAIDALILNAAFKLEEKKQNETLSEDEITKSIGISFSTPLEQKAYYDNLRMPEQRRKLVDIENEAYKLKYANKLLANKDILMAGINLDTPFFNRASEESVQSLYDDANQRLTNDIAAAMKNNQTKEEISKKADVVRYDEDVSDDVNFQQYFDKAVVTLDVKNGYREDVASFNDLDDTSYIRGNVGDLVDIDDKIAQLKNQGDSTGVFMSKTGALSVIRLEKSYGGSYGSWADFLDTYKQEYGFVKKNTGVKLKNKFAESVNMVVYGITSPGLKKAQAQAGRCSSHVITFTLRAYDIDKRVFLGGAEAELYRAPSDANCGGISGTRNIRSGSNSTVSDNCLQSSPRFEKKRDPAGYSRGTAPSALSGGGGYQHIHGAVTGRPYNPELFYPSGPADGNDPRNNQSSNVWNVIAGGPEDEGWPEWTPEQINTVEAITLLYKYRYVEPEREEETQDPVADGSMLFNCVQVYGLTTGTAMGKRYKLFEGSVSNANIIKRGTTGSTGALGYNYEAPLVGTTEGGRAYNGTTTGKTFILKIYDGSNAGDEDTKPRLPGFNGGNDLVTTTNTDQDCSDDASVRSISAINCKSVNINISDPDDRGTGVYYEVTMFQDVDPSKGTTITGRGTGDLEFDYPELSVPSTNNGWHVYLKVKNVLPNNGGDGAFTSEDYYREVGSCYQASCSLSFTPTIGPGVKAGQNFTVNYSITNTGDDDNNPLYSNIAGYNLGVTRADGGTSPEFDSQFTDKAIGIEVGRPGTATGSFELRAPDTVNNYSIQVYPDYYGLFPVGGACPAVTIPVYRPYKVDPIATLPNAEPNREDPSRITYSAGAKQEESGNVDGVAYTTDDIKSNVFTSLFYYKQGVYDPGDLHNGSFLDRYFNEDMYTSGDDGLVFTDTTPGPQFRPGDTWREGDEFCGKSFVSNASGWKGPGVDNYFGATSAETQDCAKILNTPYVKVYGADVFGGGQFGSTGGSGEIKGYVEDAASGAGTGAEFAALAVGAINGFTTASTRSTPPTPANGLLFANMGGNFRSTPDYYTASLKGDTQRADITSLAANSVSDASATVLGQTKTTGNLVLNPNPADGTSYSRHHAVFVDGDVTIRNNLVYAGSGSWTSIEQIPAFDLIVRGNIYIANNVSQLDGTYVAQPRADGTGGGRIYTCSKPDGTTFNSGELYNNCQTKLVVNGAFVAQELRLLRTKNTLRDIPFTFSATVPENRVYKRETFGNNGDDDLASESFRLSPEYFLARRALKPDGSQANGKFDYYVTLPPVL